MGIKKEIKSIEKNIERDIKHAEKWAHQRRKFFIKLSYVVGFIVFLLIISHFYLRISGVGV